MKNLSIFFVLFLWLILAGHVAQPSIASEANGIDFQFKTPAINALPMPPCEKQNAIIHKAEDKKANMDPRLKHFISRWKMAGRKPAGEKLRVILIGRPDRKIDIDEIKNLSGKILNTGHNLTAVEISIDKIEEIINNVDGVEWARLPFKFFSCGQTSEGVSLTGASKFHSAGYRGFGVKVAVIDVGFKGLSAAKANGDIPYGAITRDFTGKGLETQYKHGTGCAEIVYDMAPEAKLYLLKIEDEIDFYEAFDFCNDNGIDIISLSIGTFGSGPGDGTGPLADLCNFAMENGILVVAAAGNQANFSSNGTLIGTHWEGVFLDQGDNDWWADGSNDVHRFVPNELSSRYNVIAAEPYRDDDGNPETDDLTVLLRWDDWPYADIDYDIYLFNYYTGTLVAYSNYVQNGAQQPLEAIILDLPDSENYWHYYYLVVAKPNGEPVGTKIELYLGGQSFFMPFWPYSSPIATSSSSIIEPADAQSVLTVGAIGYGKWTTGPQEDFSSQGPTNAWAGSIARVKPDICGPDGVSGYSYGPSSFFGTSAATPHVAGAAALILSMFPNLSHDQLRTIIESSAIDMGATGKDNLFGWGRLNINVHFDIDGSGIFEIKDAILALQICAGISPGSKIYKEADIDGDGRIGLKEAVFTLQIVSGSRFD